MNLKKRNYSKNKVEEKIADYNDTGFTFKSPTKCFTQNSDKKKSLKSKSSYNMSNCKDFDNEIMSVQSSCSKSSYYVNL